MKQDQELRVEGERYSALILCQDQILLMFRRKDSKEYYSLPGGHRRQGETPERTAIREIKEETNIDIENPKLLYRFVNDYDQSLNLVFLIRIPQIIEPQLIGEEKDYSNEKNYYEPMWVELQRIPELVLYPQKIKELIETSFISNNGESGFEE